MPGRQWTVETHPEREAIIAAMIDGKSSLRAIAGRYDVPKECLSRYLSERLSEKAAAVRAEQDKAEGQAVLDRLEAVRSRMQKLYDACDEYLRDPDNPDKYYLGPHADEIDVTYRTVEPDTDKMITRKESLQSLIRKLDEQAYTPWEIRFKQADPRRLIIDTANALCRELELVAKIEGAIKDTVINVTFNQYWARFKQIIIAATEGYPEVRARIVAKMEEEQDE